MKGIPLNADVECTDGPAGQSTTVIVDPESVQVTHFVVRERKPPHSQRLVPMAQIVETTPDSIRLRCTLDQLAKMKQFVVTEYRQVEIPRYVGADTAAPYAFYEVELLTVERERIPRGKLAIRRGARVEASDGPVGRADQLVTDSESGQITHLILREGHVWGAKDVVLPVSVVKVVTGETVYLTLDKETISAMLAIPSQWLSRAADAELMVSVFKAADKADAALDTLKESVKKGALKVLNIAVMVKDNDGQTSLKETEDIDPKHGALFGAITGGLVGLLGGPVGAIVGAAAGAATGHVAADRIDMGFPDEYLKKLQEGLQPGASALVTLVEREWTEKVPEVLAGFEGEHWRHAVTDDLLAQIGSSPDT